MNILIVEDNLLTRKLLEDKIDKSYNVTSVTSGECALRELSTKEYQFLILDINLPGISGIDVLKEVKNNTCYKDPYVLVLTSNIHDEEVIEAFKLGADDYIKKPFNIVELNFRLKSGAKNKYSFRREIIVYSNIEIICNEMIIKLDGEIIEVSEKEYEILKYLILNQSKIVEKKKIFQEIWKKTYFPENRTLDVLINRIKNKFPIIKENLQTIYGKGMVLKSCL
ncbi:response regulator transcription factor [Cetobacterium sp. SF1]|uniref:response regulator transcription factor n=1 Tax=unclassified Cetobacterium TaxID=2630983 RepID=UPI003CEE51D8